MGIAVTTIRPMTEEDLPEIVSLETALQSRPWSEQVFRDELDADNRTYLVAASSQGILGFAGVMVIEDEAHVTNLLVAEDSRGEGIGKELMITLLEAAIAQKARHITLEVRTRNRAARALYARLGLVPVGMRPRYYGDDDALILWAHDITRPGYLESLR